MIPPRLGLPLAATLFVTLLTASASAEAPEKVRFNRHVRSILSANCFYCHGPDESHREADLRLDTRDGATADLGGYAAVVPGKPDESMLLERVSSHDPDSVMPPPASKKAPLTTEEVAILRRWIEQGAEYEGHWAFLPLNPGAMPAVNDSQWPQNAIDRYILARLEQEGVRPSTEADRYTLIRRVSLDLTGLLPTPEEVEAFVNDSQPLAYERLVERLLGSPHFGERWGRHWLDQARYADSNGYTIDSERTMWPYRDWVIKAINDDLPFDQFTTEQLAGDLLPSPSKSQLVATGFHRNTLINEEGGTDREQFRHEAVVDRANTTGAVWLGLTVGCAQCHTHKFDPITHREYYELFAFFNQSSDVNSKGATVKVAPGEIFGEPLHKPDPSLPSEQELAQRQADWETAERARLEAQASDSTAVTWKPVAFVEHETKSGAALRLLDDSSLLLEGRGAAHEEYRLVAKAGIERVAAVRLRTLTHESLPKQGPGSASNGNFVLTRLTIRVGGAEQKIAAAFADHEQPGFPVIGVADADPKSGWAINAGSGSKAKMNANHEAVLILEKPATLGDALLEVSLHHELNAGYLVGRFALDVAETAPTPNAVNDQALATALQTPREKRTPDQGKLVQEAFAKFDPEARAAKARLDALATEMAEAMVMKDLDTPRTTFVAQRGDFLRPDKALGALQPDVLDVVPPALPPSERRNRLDLARWLTHPENPLTPRVTINRLWMRYFGRGLAETDEDFGTQGAAPTHPELLDWLSTELIRRGWSLKEMHRLIVTSATYRQSSQARPDLRTKDPRNLLLARQERLRTEAETVRDAALSASGLLSRTIGGPSVRPPQPDGVYAFTQSAKRWTAETGANRYRRALYTTFFRSAPHPLFATFDAPDFQTVCTRRARSNTPLQALTVANDEAFFEFAQGLAARVMKETQGLSLDDRLRRVFVLGVCRPPSGQELATLRGYYDRQAAHFTKEPASAVMLLRGDFAGEPSPEAAAMVCVSRLILNTDNFITRE